jgi:hypothetical protein
MFRVWFRLAKAREKGPLAAACYLSISPPRGYTPLLHRKPPTIQYTALVTTFPVRRSPQSSFRTHHQIRESLDYNKVNGATDSIDSQPEVKGKSLHGWKFEPNSSPRIGKCISSVNTCWMATSRAVLESRTPTLERDDLAFLVVIRGRRYEVSKIHRMLKKKLQL